MTVAVQTPVITYQGNGSAAPLAVPFRFIANDHVRVIRTVDGVETLLVRGTHYALAGAGNPSGGTVTPTAAIPVGTSWRIERATTIEQPTDYVEDDGFPADAHERGLDRQAMIAQELAARVTDTATRALQVPRGETGFTLPPSASLLGLPQKMLAIDPDTGRPDVLPISDAFRGPPGGSNNTITSRAASTEIDVASESSIILAGQDDRGVFTLDTRIPAGETGPTDQRTPGYNNPGRKRRYLTPGSGTGRFVNEFGQTHVGSYGISPWASAGHNDAWWNYLRDEIGDLQTRQENRPLYIVFDNDRYPMSAVWEVRNNHINIEGRGAELVDGAISFTNNGSINQQLNCAIRNCVIRGAPGQPVPTFRTLVSSYLTVDNVEIWGTAGQHGVVLGPGNTSTFKQLRVRSAGNQGILMQAENAPHPLGGTAGRGHPIDLTFIDVDVQGCGGGIAIYESASIRFLGGAIQNGTGLTGRGLSIESGYGVTVVGTHFEKNGTDIYVQPVNRVGTALWGSPLPHGSITLLGAEIGGEGIGGAPSPTSLLIAGDTADFYALGGFYSGAVNINTAGSTGLFGAKAGSYADFGPSGIIRLGAKANAIAAPTGGSVIDVEARATLNALRSALQNVGMLKA